MVLPVVRAYLFASPDKHGLSVYLRTRAGNIGTSVGCLVVIVGSEYTPQLTIHDNLLTSERNGHGPPLCGHVTMGMLLTTLTSALLTLLMTMSAVLATVNALLTVGHNEQT